MTRPSSLLFPLFLSLLFLFLLWTFKDVTMSSSSSSTHSSSLPRNTLFPIPSSPRSPFHHPLVAPIIRSSILAHRTSAVAAAALAGLRTALPVAEAATALASVSIVHEAGHLLAAALRGIRVSQFNIGFGPVIVRFVAGGVEYSLRAFPFDGFVEFPAADDASADHLKNRPVLDRLIVVTAGVAANVAFACLILFFQALTVGLLVAEPLTEGLLVPEVGPGSAAAICGLQPGDVIIEIDGAPVSEDSIKMNPGRSVAMKVAREGTESLELRVVPDGTGSLGVPFSHNRVSKVRAKNLAEAIALASEQFLVLAYVALDGLMETLNFCDSTNKLSGPVTTIAAVAKVAEMSSSALFQVVAFINLNAAVVNLLPFPPLDGWSLALILVEAGTGGKKFPPELEDWIWQSGLVAMRVLQCFVMVRDLIGIRRAGGVVI